LWQGRWEKGPSAAFHFEGIEGEKLNLPLSGVGISVCNVNLLNVAHKVLILLNVLRVDDLRNESIHSSNDIIEMPLQSW
jgi:high-affinity Fe2+/Pb2+ permease